MNTFQLTLPPTEPVGFYLLRQLSWAASASGYRIGHVFPDVYEIDGTAHAVTRMFVSQHAQFVKPSIEKLSVGDGVHLDVMSIYVFAFQNIAQTLGSLAGMCEHGVWRSRIGKFQFGYEASVACVGMEVDDLAKPSCLTIYFPEWAPLLCKAIVASLPSSLPRGNRGYSYSEDEVTYYENEHAYRSAGSRWLRWLPSWCR